MLLLWTQLVHFYHGPGPVNEQIIRAFASVSTRLWAAARCVLGRPRDVALPPMRDQARQAGVQAAAMTRFVRHLGMESYHRVREICPAADGDLGFAGKADAHVASRRFTGDKAVAAQIQRSIGRQVDRLVAVAARRVSARHAPRPPQAAIRRASRDDNLAAGT